MLIQRLREKRLNRVATNFTTTLNTPVNLDTLLLSALANEAWRLDAQLTAQCSGTGGLKYAIAAPAGSTIEGWLYSSTVNITTLSYQRFTLINTLNGTAVHTVVTTPGPDRIIALVTLGATAGQIALQVASGTNGQTTTIFTGSTLIADRVV